MHCVNRDGGLQACHINPDCHNYLRVTDFTHPDIITFYERFLYSLNVPHTISQISLVSASQRGLHTAPSMPTAAPSVPTAPSLPHSQQQRGQSTNSTHSQRTNNSNNTHSQRTSNTNSTQCAEQTTTPSGNVYCTKPPSNITEMQLCTTQDALHVDYTYSEDD